MIEYCSINNSQKSPRKECIAFDKIDGSNCRFKYTQQGFKEIGTRTQLIDSATPFWSEIVSIFNEKYRDNLESFFRNSPYKNFKQIILFGEFVGENSFAGRHEKESHDIVFFDALCGHKNHKLVLPQNFVEDFNFLPIPKIIYKGELNERFIEEIRHNAELKEGVICKGVERRGDYFGGVWTAKIKTNKYLQSLKDRLGENWKKYWE